MKPFLKVVTTVAAAVLVAHASANEIRAGQSASSAALMWNRIAQDVVERTKPTQHQAIRLLAYVSIAQHAALANTQQGSLHADSVATASARVITELAPSQAAYIGERLTEAGARIAEPARAVADNVLAHARRDEFARPHTGQVPQGAQVWRSLANPPAPPAYPAIGGMRTFLLESGSVFRAAPPPAPDSERFRADLADVARYTASPTAETTRLAKYYDMTTGTLAGGFWNATAAEQIRKSGMNDRQAARVFATMNMAMMDALVACHDTKYAYWVPRPSQADPSIRPLIGVPNHPAYPSNHSCISTAASQVLAHFFPGERAHLEAVATEAGLSRIYAGLHYRFDVTAGEDIGRSVAAVALARHEEALARLTRTLLAQRALP